MRTCTSRSRGRGSSEVKRVLRSYWPEDRCPKLKLNRSKPGSRAETERIPVA